MSKHHSTKSKASQLADDIIDVASRAGSGPAAVLAAPIRITRAIKEKRKERHHNRLNDTDQEDSQSSSSSSSSDTGENGEHA